MNAFEIIGGKPLKGEITPQGAKNEALQIISAVLLTEKKVTISNIPDIKDVNKLIELLSDLGVMIERIPCHPDNVLLIFSFHGNLGATLAPTNLPTFAANGVESGDGVNVPRLSAPGE
jgi:5-enolpyruvylshikimate-3-phosphate synthase